MDFFQAVVHDFLRARPSRFVNSECLLQLDNTTSPRKNEHWYCDFLAIDFEQRAVYLCETTYAKNVAGLRKRLMQWRQHWPKLKAAIRRDCHVPADWHFAIWIFVPSEHIALVRSKIAAVDVAEVDLPLIEVIALESILPWKYRSWSGVPYD